MESLRRLLLAFVSFVGAGELALRIAAPTPRVQAIRAAEVTSFELVDGVPFWAAEDPEVPHRCNSDARPRAVFVGSSIFRGSGLGSGAEVFSSQLSELAPGWCVDNVAEPAFTGPQKAIAAMRAIAVEPPPKRVYWEVWDNDPARWWSADGTAWNLVHHPTAPGWGPVRGQVAAWLFVHSALWRTSLLAFAGAPGGDVDAFAAGLRRDLGPVLEVARARGVEVVVVVATPLDRSFVESVVHPNPMLGALWPFAKEQGVRWIRLALALQDEDVEALRLDPCCHFNAQGHRVLAVQFADDLGAPGP